jgi:hypothetical protein
VDPIAQVCATSSWPSECCWCGVIVTFGGASGVFFYFTSLLRRFGWIVRRPLLSEQSDRPSDDRVARRCPRPRRGGSPHAALPQPALDARALSVGRAGGPGLLPALQPLGSGGTPYRLVGPGEGYRGGPSEDIGAAAGVSVVTSKSRRCTPTQAYGDAGSRWPGWRRDRFMDPRIVTIRGSYALDDSKSSANRSNASPRCARSSVESSAIALSVCTGASS